MTETTTNPSVRVKPVVVVHFDANGQIDYLKTSETTLLIIDENAPDDRVYMYDGNATWKDIAALIGDSRIGHSGDGYLSEAEVQSIRARLWVGDGNSLSVIEGDKP